MSGLFYNLGRKAGPHIRKAKWIWQSLSGTDEDIIRIEQQVGYDLAVEFRQQLKHAPDAKMEQFLNEVGSRLAGRVAHRLRKFNFDFFEDGFLKKLEGAVDIFDVKIEKKVGEGVITPREKFSEELVPSFQAIADN